MSEPRSERDASRVGLSRAWREGVEFVGLVYDHPGLSHSVLIFADVLPFVFETFPAAEVVVFNHGENGTNVASLYRAPAKRRLVVKDRSFHVVAGDWLTEAAARPSATLFFERLTVSRALLPQAGDVTLHLHAFSAPPREAEVDVYRRGSTEAERLRFPVEGGVQERQRGMIEHLGLSGFPHSRESSLLDERTYSDALAERIAALRATHPELGNGRPLLFANLLKSMNGDWTFEGETPQVVKARWVAALELVARQLPVDLMLNPGPREWTANGWFPSGAGAPLSENWERLSAREEMRRLGRHLRQLPGRRVRLVDLEGNCGLLELAALLHLVKESGGALLDVHTGTTHLAEWMGTPEAVEHNPVIGGLVPDRANLVRVEVGRPGVVGEEAFGWRMVEAISGLIADD